MKRNILILFLSCITFGFAQNRKATLENIQQDGFHKTLITPEIRSASNDNLDFFRIFDSKKREVPYVVFENTNKNTFLFQKLKITSKNAISDSLTSITFENYTSKNNDEIVVFVSNSKINKTYNVSGSLDGKEWFGLVSNQILSDLNSTTETFVEKTIAYPSNNYKFIKIDFNDKKSLPINVLDVGYYVGKQHEIENILLEKINYKISENKKEKKTIINFTSEEKQRIDGISFKIDDKYFSRNATLSIKKIRKFKKQTEEYQEVISSFYLNSNATNSFQVSDLFVSEFTIVIQNQDNQHLQISSILMNQKPLYIVADLKANEMYDVIIDSTFTKPSYDLSNFVQSFSVGIPKATISILENNDLQKENASDQPFWQSKAFMWFCILLGIAVIGYFAIGLLKDMKE